MKATAICGVFVALLLAAGAHAHEGRKTLAAGAPEPMHPHPWAMAPGPAGMMRDCHHEKHEDPLRANLLFIVSADEAKFTTASTLQLTGVSSTVQYHDAYDKADKAGLIRTPVFTNGTAGARYVSADGTWLNVPDAALMGNANNSNGDQDTAVLLTLSNPMFDAATKSVTFTIAVLATEESALKTHGGVTNSLVMDQKNSVGMPVVTQVTPGATLSNVALFIDTTKAALTPLAQEKDWWRPWGWGGGWGSGGGWGGGWGWGGGGGWGRDRWGGGGGWGWGR